MHIDTDAVVCGLITHGEHGGIVRLLTPEHGLVAAYVRGARGRRVRPVLIPGNMVSAQLRFRTENQLPQASLELTHSRAPILAEPLPAAAIEWVTVLVTAALAERQPHPRIFEAMTGLLDAIEAAPSAKGWAAALAQFELLVAAELGYGREAAEPPARVTDWPEILGALQLSGDSLSSDMFAGRSLSLGDSRARLLERLRRVAR
jgi:DNA repair protein RecO (recombination protein O)